MKQPADNFLSSLSPLQLSLGGSVLLHTALLLGLPAPGQHAPASTLVVHLTPSVAQQQASATPARIPPPVPNKTSVPVDTPAPAEPAPAAAVPAEAITAAEPAAEPTIFSAAQLDSPPRLLGELHQIYPARARAAEVEGYVTLALLINERGEVEEVSVVRAQPAGYFEEAALSMLRKQRFTPPIKQNRAVKSRWQTTVRYRLQS